MLRSRVRTKRWILAVLLVLPGAGCVGQNANSSTKQPKNVAMVNGEPITLEEFQAALNEEKEDGTTFLTDNDTARRVKRDLLERLIDTRVLVQETRRRHIIVDPKVVDAQMALMAAQYPDGRLEEELKKKGKTSETYRQESENLLLLNQLLKQEVVDRIAISKNEIGRYYQGHQQSFLKPEEVRVRQIVTRTEQEAKELRQQILQGGSFEELARKNSLGPEGQAGGDLGYFPRGRMPPVIEQACFELGPSRASQVVASPYGFHLFQLIDRRPSRMLSLDEAQPEIERILTEERTKEAESYYIRTLREKSKVERDINLLDWTH